MRPALGLVYLAAILVVGAFVAPILLILGLAGGSRPPRM